MNKDFRIGDNIMKKSFITLLLTLMLGACAQMEPEPFVKSSGHIQASSSPTTNNQTNTPAAQIPAIVEATPVLPEPAKPVSQERYTVVVNEVPVKELLFALARDAKVNVDIHPEIDGIVTINAVEQTLPQILKRISKQVDMRYEYDGDNLLISRDTPFLRTYTIDYVNMSREMTSTNTVATQIATTSSGDSSTGGSGGGGGGGSNNSTTDVSSESNHSFWQTLISNVSAIISDSDTVSTSVNSSSVIANPESGLLMVRATSKQHIEVQEFVDRSLASAKRQVIIRATIAEVQLSEDYQAGIDWSLLGSATKAGFEVVSTTINPATAFTSFVLRYDDPNTNRDQRLQASITLLDEFGDSRILSSPQLMVLNNQTAVLKVVENIVYFEIDTDTTATQGVSTTTFDTTAQTVPVGIVMAVTPQISASGEISLNVRPTISRVTEFVNDPNPSLIVGGTTISNPVPQISVREMESMLRLNEGQIGILGGLMVDQDTTDEDGLPVLKDIEGVGSAFKTRTLSQTKTELVIFLQPFVINSPSLDGDLQQYRQYLNDLSVYGRETEQEESQL
ncbi:MAG: secretin N-terminal domain-containing protein [Pseudomonadota bacterium]